MDRRGDLDGHGFRGAEVDRLPGVDRLLWPNLGDGAGEVPGGFGALEGECSFRSWFLCGGVGRRDFGGEWWSVE